MRIPNFRGFNTDVLMLSFPLKKGREVRRPEEYCWLLFLDKVHLNLKSFPKFPGLKGSGIACKKPFNLLNGFSSILQDMYLLQVRVLILQESGSLMTSEGVDHPGVPVKFGFKVNTVHRSIIYCRSSLPRKYPSVGNGHGTFGV